MRPLYTFSSLRTVLLVDSIVCFATGLLLFIAAVPLASLFFLNPVPVLGLEPPAFLAYVGVAVILIGLGVFVVARVTTIRPFMIWQILAIEIVWIIGCAALLATRSSALSLIGTSFIILAGITVFAFLVLEWFGLRELQAGTSQPTPVA
jgi:hypothetical protein